MNSIWNNLYDRAKDRRYGVLFFFSLFGFFGVVLAGFITEKLVGGSDFGSFLQSHFLELVPGIAILIVALIWRAIRRTRTQRGKRFRREELSRDEIRKARSKLVSQTKL